MADEYREKLSKVLKETLTPGEEILWQSGAATAGLLEGPSSRAILAKWGISLACPILAWVYMAKASQHRTSILVILLGIMALLILSPVLEWKDLSRQYYVLTNQRAILIRKNMTAEAMELAAVDDARIVKPTAKEACLVLGSRLTRESAGNLRSRSLHPLEESGDSRVCGMVFYGIRNADRALELVSRYTTA